MEPTADMDVSRSPWVSASTQNRILIWRSEVISHLPPLLQTSSPSSNSSITSGTSSNSIPTTNTATTATTNDPFSPSSKPTRLWTKLRNRLSLSTSSTSQRDPAASQRRRLGVGVGGRGGGAKSAAGIRTEMYQDLAANYIVEDEEDDEGGGDGADNGKRHHQIKYKQERLARAAKMLDSKH